MLPLVASYMVYEYFTEFKTLLMKAVNDKQKFKHVPYLNLNYDSLTR